ncbi:hypothetical protein [Brevibacterium permense]|uniref:Uncharacterized protein n=1 Tax=Brevibacterium permense TaxID=234834 RepID=A0ABP4LNG6_9MICO|nr:hypothetical protein [Brevibacterium permense]
MNWTDPPEVIVPLSGWAYFGYTMLGLFALIVFVAASLLLANGEGAAGWILAGGGTLLYAPAAFAYLRTVEIALDMPNMAIWAGLLAAGAATSFALHKLRGGYFEVSSLLPFAGATAATVGAAGLDKANEQLAHIPMAWATVVGLLLIGGFLVARMGGVLR